MVWSKSMNIMVAVPVYNRKKYVDILANSLSECQYIDKTDVRVYDDCSTEFDINYLRNTFNKLTSKIIRREKRNGILAVNLFEMMHDFLNSDNDVLFLCDSDLLLRPDAIKYLYDNFDLTDGFMSLYDSDLHLTVKQGQKFKLKLDVGHAGMCISRECVQLLLNKNSKDLGDFKISETIIKNNKRILVPVNGCIQHIGDMGKNASTFAGMDYSTSFIPVSEHNKKIIQEITSVVILRQATLIKNLFFNDKYRRDGFFLHQPIKHLKTKNTIRKLKKLEVL